jgi:hypothetical protein
MLATERIFEVSSELIDKVKAAGNIRLERLQGGIASGSLPLHATAPVKARNLQELVLSTLWC